MSHPTISVVIPTYNRKGLLKNCLESLFVQDYPKNNYEIIVVDDGSTDGTEKIVKNIAKTNNSRFRYIKQQNKGPATARNRGIKNSKGEIVAFIDDDCIADKYWLSNILECFKNDIVGVEGKVVSKVGKTPFTHQVENLNGKLYLTANIAYKKNILLKVGMFYESFQSPTDEDWDLAFRILEKGEKIKFCEKAIVIHPARDMDLKDWIKVTWIQWATSSRVYNRHKTLWKETTGHSLPRAFFDGVFLYLFVFGKKWRGYLIANPSKLPKFIIYYLIRSGVIALASIKNVFQVSS